MPAFFLCFNVKTHEKQNKTTKIQKIKEKLLTILRDCDIIIRNDSTGRKRYAFDLKNCMEIFMKYYAEPIARSPRIPKLVEALFEKMPQIEADRAVLLTESYKQTEGEPIITRRAKAFRHILENIPITIRDNELIVGSATKSPRSCQVFPEYSFEWLEAEFDTVESRSADPFYISEDTKETLREVYKYWKGRTTSELAYQYMSEEARNAIEHNMFTPGNYFYNGVGHVTVDYAKVLEKGYSGIIAEAKAELEKLSQGDADYAKRTHFLNAVIMSCRAVCDYAKRYSVLAASMAKTTADITRRKELEKIAEIYE